MILVSMTINLAKPYKGIRFCRWFFKILTSLYPGYCGTDIWSSMVPVERENGFYETSRQDSTSKKLPQYQSIFPFRFLQGLQRYCSPGPLRQIILHLQQVMQFSNPPIFPIRFWCLVPYIFPSPPGEAFASDPIGPQVVLIVEILNELRGCCCFSGYCNFSSSSMLLFSRFLDVVVVVVVELIIFTKQLNYYVIV